MQKARTQSLARAGGRRNCEWPPAPLMLPSPKARDLPLRIAAAPRTVALTQPVAPRCRAAPGLSVVAAWRGLLLSAATGRACAGCLGDSSHLARARSTTAVNLPSQTMHVPGRRTPRCAGLRRCAAPRRGHGLPGRTRPPSTPLLVAVSAPASPGLLSAAPPSWASGASSAFSSVAFSSARPSLGIAGSSTPKRPLLVSSTSGTGAPVPGFLSHGILPPWYSSYIRISSAVPGSSPRPAPDLADRGWHPVEVALHGGDAAEHRHLREFREVEVTPALSRTPRRGRSRAPVSASHSVMYQVQPV